MEIDFCFIRINVFLSIYFTFWQGWSSVNDYLENIEILLRNFQPDFKTFLRFFKAMTKHKKSLLYKMFSSYDIFQLIQFIFNWNEKLKKNLFRYFLNAITNSIGSLPFPLLRLFSKTCKLISAKLNVILNQ